MTPNMSNELLHLKVSNQMEKSISIQSARCWYVCQVLCSKSKCDYLKPMSMKCYTEFVWPKMTEVMQRPNLGLSKLVTDNLWKTVWTHIRTNRMSALIWIHTIWHIDRVPERFFLKMWIWEKSAEANKSMKNYPVGRVNEGMTLLF